MKGPLMHNTSSYIIIMEELFIPMHMRRDIGIGDVIISEMTPAGIIIKETTKHPTQPVIANSTVEFEIGGSGFLVAVNHRTKANTTNVLGLIVTAAHVVCNVGNSFSTLKEYKVKLESGETCIAYFLKDYSRLFTEEIHWRHTALSTLTVCLVTQQFSFSLH